MSRVVHLHIGAPKTGTTYLQDRLGANAASLAAHGVHFPKGPLGLDPGNTHFKAALDLLGADWGGAPGHAEGHWEALMRRVRRTSGSVVISHEILASARPEKIERAMHDLRGSEVHVVYSARDLARQLPAVWQEGIKQGRRWTFAKFLDDMQHKPDLWWWRVLSLPGVLSRWSAGLPPERVHLVTVPHSADRPDELWLRFCQAFGIDPAWAPAEAGRANPSMGVAETALVRQLNRRLYRNGLADEHHAALVKEMLVHQNLANRKGQRATLPPALHEWAAGIAESWIDWAVGSGIEVIGDVADLRPLPPPEGEPWVDPDKPRPNDVVAAALDALVAMTEEAANRPDPNAQLSARMGRAARRLRGP